MNAELLAAPIVAAGFSGISIRHLLNTERIQEETEAMPIKVRCNECSTVLTVSDQAAGRAVKCKKCGGRVPVPAAGSSAPPAQKKKKKKPRPPAFDEPSDPADMFGGLDLDEAEGDEKLCPNCATVVDEEDFECPECGVNIETGALSQQQKAKRKRKGPPPEEFYKAAMPNAWEFVMNHKGFVVRSGITWGLSCTMVICSAFILNWYVTHRTVELLESAENVQFSDAGALIAPTKEQPVKYDGVIYSSESVLLGSGGTLLLPTPFWACIRSPPGAFWCFIFLVFLLGMGGWAWTLSAKVVEVTLAREKVIKRFSGDVIGDMTKGFTTIFWPVVLLYPVIWIPLAMNAGGVDPQLCVITFVCLFLLPYVIFLPVAAVHMAQPYTYRAWLLNWMCKDFVNTIAPSMFISAIFFCTVMLVPLGICIGVALGWDSVSNFYTNSIELPTLKLIGYEAASEGSTGYMIFGRFPLMFMIGFLVLSMLFTLIAIPAIFVMRLFGLFGLYFRPDMSLCAEQVPLSNASFGPRFLAIQVDMVVGAIIVAVCIWLSGFVAKLFGFLYNSEAITVYGYYALIVISTVGTMGFYFANWESGAGRATLGKWTLGLLVLQENNKPVKFKQAVNRYLASLLSVISLGGTFIMCAFHQDYRAFHDVATKTKVVWRGDENQ